MPSQEFLGYAVLFAGIALALYNYRGTLKRFFNNEPAEKLEPEPTNPHDLSWDRAVDAAKYLRDYHKHHGNEAGLAAAIQAGKCLFTDTDETDEESAST